jgi:hypothetical protein
MMRSSDAGLRRRPTKLVYPDHRLTPCLTEDAPRDRSNRLLGQLPRFNAGDAGASAETVVPPKQFTVHVGLHPTRSET